MEPRPRGHETLFCESCWRMEWDKTQESWHGITEDPSIDSTCFCSTGLLAAWLTGNGELNSDLGVNVYDGSCTGAFKLKQSLSLKIIRV